MEDKYLIDGHKLLWHLDRVCLWQKDPCICPIYIEVSPSSLCNHKCIFCGVDFARTKKFLNFDGYIKFIKFMAKEGLRSVMFAGEGEPLLNKQITQMIRSTKQLGIDVALVTNGNLASQNILEGILPYLTWIRFSVDAGSEEIYSLVHRVDKKNFKIVVENIERSTIIKKNNNLPVTIGVQYLVIEENLNDLENFLNIFSYIDVDYVVLKPFSLHPQMINKRDTNYIDQIIYNIENIISKYNHKLNIIFRKNSFKNYIQKNKKYTRCYALPFWGHLSAEGDFHTCSVFIGDSRFHCGNIFTENFKEIIYGKKRKDSIIMGRYSLDVKKECRVNCRMSKINEFLEQINTPPEHVNFI